MRIIKTILRLEIEESCAGISKRNVKLIKLNLAITKEIYHKKYFLLFTIQNLYPDLFHSTSSPLHRKFSLIPFTNSAKSPEIAIFLP